MSKKNYAMIIGILILLLLAPTSIAVLQREYIRELETKQSTLVWERDYLVLVAWMDDFIQDSGIEVRPYWQHKYNWSGNFRYTFDINLNQTSSVYELTSTFLLCFLDIARRYNVTVIYRANGWYSHDKNLVELSQEWYIFLPKSVSPYETSPGSEWQPIVLRISCIGHNPHLLLSLNPHLLTEEAS